VRWGCVTASVAGEGSPGKANARKGARKRQGNEMLWNTVCGNALPNVATQRTVKGDRVQTVATNAVFVRVEARETCVRGQGGGGWGGDAAKVLFRGVGAARSAMHATDSVVRFA